MSSILQILKSKDLREYIEGVYKDDFERFSDGTYRSICNIHGGDNPSTFTIYRDWETDRKSTRLNSSHITRSRMPSSA